MAEGRMLSKRITRSEKVAALKTDTARMLYTWLIPYLDVDGRCDAHPSLLKADLAPLLPHITPEKIKTILVELHSIGLIILYSLNGKQYLEVTKFDEHQKNLRKDRETPSKIPDMTQESIQSDAGVTPELVPLKIKIKIKERESKRQVPGFEEFWELYPRKVNKKEAQLKWNRVNLPSLEFILEAIKKQKQSQQWNTENGKYIPHPATWLNQERWNDELPEVEDHRSEHEKEIDDAAARANRAVED
jgi:hypothetical protein